MALKGGSGEKGFNQVRKKTKKDFLKNYGTIRWDREGHLERKPIKELFISLTKVKSCLEPL